MASATLGMSKSFKSNSVLQKSADHLLLESIDKTITALDYSQFLKHWSSELVSGGVLILSIPCVDGQGIIGFECILGPLYTCAQLLPLTSTELLGYTNPVHCRSCEECIDENLCSQNGFQLIKFTTVSIGAPLYKKNGNKKKLRSMNILRRQHYSLKIFWNQFLDKHFENIVEQQKTFLIV